MQDKTATPVDSMKSYVALLRAVNVGGTGLLAMKDLAALATDLGLVNARTYIQSGNLLFESDLSKTQVQGVLSEALHRKTNRGVEVLIRTSCELDALLHANPFAGEPGNKVAVIFLPVALEIASLSGPAGEQVRAHGAEIFVYYPIGMGNSKLRLPAAAAQGTARNINTVRKLLELSDGRHPTVKKRHEK